MNTHMQHKTIRGITLIELVVVVAVVAILASIAYPSYQHYILKAHRSEAHTILLQIIARAEQYYSVNNTYPTTLAATYAPSTIPTSSFYTFSATLNNTTNVFSAIATATDTQANDTDCLTLTTDTVGTKTPATCWS